MDQLNEAKLMIKIPLPLKKRIMEVSHRRKMNDRSDSSMNAVALEALNNGIEKVEADEQVQKMGA